MARNVEFGEELAIQRAMEVFWRKGYHGASMRDLTEAMQINSSSLYNTIGDKRQLFARCMYNYIESGKEAAMSHARNNSSPLNAIISFIREGVDTILKNNSCMALKTTFDIASTDSEVKAILKDGSDFANQFLLELINKAIEENEIDKDIDAKILTDIILSAFTGWHQSFILNQDPVRIRKVADFLIKQIQK